MRPFILSLALLALSACSRDDPRLLNLARDTGPGPDEFSVLPTEPLQIPDDLAALPEPDPGGWKLHPSRGVTDGSCATH